MKWEIRSLPNVIFAIPITSYTVLPTVFGETSSTRALSWFIVFLILVLIIVLLFKPFSEKWTVIGSLGGMIAGALLLKLAYFPLTVLGVLVYSMALFVFILRRKERMAAPTFVED